MSDARQIPEFRELEHTADLGIEVSGSSASELFGRAGLALFSLMVEPAGIEGREHRVETVSAEGWEETLAVWLSRLLGLFLVEGFVACTIHVRAVSSSGVTAELEGERLDWDRHRFRTEIKGVTRHRLAVEHDGERWSARVIFDV